MPAGTRGRGDRGAGRRSPPPSALTPARGPRARVSPGASCSVSSGGCGHSAVPRARRHSPERCQETAVKQSWGVRSGRRVITPKYSPGGWLPRPQPSRRHLDFPEEPGPPGDSPTSVTAAPSRAEQSRSRPPRRGEGDRRPRHYRDPGRRGHAGRGHKRHPLGLRRPRVVVAVTRKQGNCGVSSEIRGEKAVFPSGGTPRAPGPVPSLGPGLPSLLPPPTPGPRSVVTPSHCFSASRLSPGGRLSVPGRGVALPGDGVPAPAVTDTTQPASLPSPFCTPETASVLPTGVGGKHPLSQVHPSLPLSCSRF